MVCEACWNLGSQQALARLWLAKKEEVVKYSKYILLFYRYFYDFICFFISFNRFSTEDLRLATGASTPVARKQKKFLYVCKEGIVKGVYTVFMFFQKFQIFSEKVGFCSPPE